MEASVSNVPGAGQGVVQGTVHDVAVEVLRHGPLPRSQLARRLGLSPGSLTRLSKPLIGSGLLVEAPPAADPETRRPTRPLDVPTGSHRFVGVDLTGTTAWGVLTDLRATVLASDRVDLTGTSPGSVVGSVAALVDRLLGGRSGRGAAGADAVGVSLGGYVEADGSVRRAPFLGWDERVDLTGMLSTALGLPVVVGNDLAALTRAEHWFGEGRGTTAFAVVTVGAGVGYGLVLHDEVVETPDSGLQLLGHHLLDSSGPRCSSGHRGCATSLLTVPALAAAGTLALARPVTFEDVLALAAGGQPMARVVVDDAARHLGTLVAAVANFTTVGRILLTGEGVGVAQVGAQALAEGVRAARDPDAAPLDVAVRPHDFHAWARGAAGMAVRNYIAGPEWLALEVAAAV